MVRCPKCGAENLQTRKFCCECEDLKSAVPGPVNQEAGFALTQGLKHPDWMVGHINIAIPDD